jgi:hypothetical protein
MQDRAISPPGRINGSSGQNRERRMGDVVLLVLRIGILKISRN